MVFARFLIYFYSGALIYPDKNTGHQDHFCNKGCHQKKSATVYLMSRFHRTFNFLSIKMKHHVLTVNSPTLHKSRHYCILFLDLQTLQLQPGGPSPKFSEAALPFRLVSGQIITLRSFLRDTTSRLDKIKNFSI